MRLCKRPRIVPHRDAGRLRFDFGLTPIGQQMDQIRNEADFGDCEPENALKVLKLYFLRSLDTNHI